MLQKALGQAKGWCVIVEGLVLGKSRDSSATVREEGRVGRTDVGTWEDTVEGAGRL